MRDLIDEEGENQAVRMFLALYGGQCGIRVDQMRRHLEMSGYPGAWPEWVETHEGHLTKAGAQLWIRHLFALEQPASKDWRLMPRTATPQMLKAMDECSKEGYDERLYAGHASSVYMAAWDAAPEPEQPAQQEPLTDAQIGAVAADIWGSVLIAPQSYQAFARAIENAHGIKGDA